MRSSDLLFSLCVVAVASSCGRVALTLDGANDVIVTDDAGDVTGCAAPDLQFSLTEAQVNQASLALVQSLKSHGVPTARVNEDPSGAANRVTVLTDGVALGIASSEDPRSGLLAWLAAAPASPFRAEDYVPLVQGNAPTSVALGDFFWATFTRRNVGDLAFPSSAQEALALRALVLKKPEGWALANFEYSPAVIFAGRSDAQVLTRCAQAQSEHPSETPVLSHEYSGYRYLRCAQTGTYTYTAHANDHIAWPDQPHWSVLTTGAPTDHASWTQVRQAELTIDPLNYFSGVEQTDCACGVPGTPQFIAGFTIQVDVRTGEVLWFQPNLHGCNIC